MGDFEVKNTLTGYLGTNFQLKLMWQLLVDSDFCERTIKDLSVDYFDDPSYKRLFIIINEYYNEYEKPPAIQNKSIYQAINLYKKPNNPIEEESLNSVLKQINLWNENVLNKKIGYDGDVVQNATTIFIKQQEYRKLGEFILNSTRTGKIKEKDSIFEIEERINRINSIGDTEDYGIEVTENIMDALKIDFRETTPTGITVLDNITGGGLGKTEVGLILTPSGAGKTTILTKIANTAYELGKNVLQIIFEDTKDDVRRKHFTIWSKVPLSKINKKREEVIEKVNEKIKTIEKGRLIIKRFISDDVTILDIKNWIYRYEKKFGIKFDVLVLDYLDCVESHKKSLDRTESEFLVIKSFLNLAAELDIPAWSATQSNRSGFGAEIVDAQHQGGSIKRIQKAHFVMSIAKTEEMKETHEANIKIIKARFAHDGQTFRNCIFNNDTMEITIVDDRYIQKGPKPEDTEEGLGDVMEELESIKESSDLVIEKTFNEENVKLTDNTGDKEPKRRIKFDDLEDVD